MIEFTPDQLVNWSFTEKGPTFVIVSTPTCPKCAEFYKTIKDDIYFAKYVHKPGKDSLAATKLLSKIGILDVPVILFRYEIGKNTKIGSYHWEDQFEIDNWFQAIHDQQYEYFGVNKFGEVIDEPPDAHDLEAIGLIKELYGDVDAQSKAERGLLRNVYSPETLTV